MKFDQGCGVACFSLVAIACLCVTGFPIPGNSEASSSSGSSLFDRTLFQEQVSNLTGLAFVETEPVLKVGAAANDSIVPVTKVPSEYSMIESGQQVELEEVATPELEINNNPQISPSIQPSIQPKKLTKKEYKDVGVGDSEDEIFLSPLLDERELLWYLCRVGKQKFWVTAKKYITRVQIIHNVYSICQRMAPEYLPSFDDNEELLNVSNSRLTIFEEEPMTERVMDIEGIKDEEEPAGPFHQVEASSSMNAITNDPFNQEAASSSMNAMPTDQFHEAEAASSPMNAITTDPFIQAEAESSSIVDIPNEYENHLEDIGNMRAYIGMRIHDATLEKVLNERVRQLVDPIRDESFHDEEGEEIAEGVKGEYFLPDYNLNFTGSESKAEEFISETNNNNTLTTDPLPMEQTYSILNGTRPERNPPSPPLVPNHNSSSAASRSQLLFIITISCLFGFVLLAGILIILINTRKNQTFQSISWWKYQGDGNAGGDAQILGTARVSSTNVVAGSQHPCPFIAAASSGDQIDELRGVEGAKIPPPICH